MKNFPNSWQVFAIVSAVFFATFTIEHKRKKMSDQTKSQGIPVFSNHRVTVDGRDLGGVTQRPGLSIHWAGSGSYEDSVRPIDVIDATIDRLQHEQTTDLGSNENAMALVELLKARDLINGTSEKMPDGTTVIQ